MAETWPEAPYGGTGSKVGSLDNFYGTFPDKQEQKDEEDPGPSQFDGVKTLKGEKPERAKQQKESR